MTRLEPRYLQCVLTQDEIKEKGKLLAQAEADHEQTEAAFNAQKKAFTGRLEEYRTKIKGLVGEINTGKEYRYIEIYESFDYERMRVDIYRQDTGEKIDQRNMTSKEIEDWRQRKLFAEEAEEAIKAMAAGAGAEVEPAEASPEASEPEEDDNDEEEEEEAEERVFLNQKSGRIRKVK